jgi:nucleoside-diphosphate-sugar epimerase
VLAVLITGASGFVGRACLAELRRAGWEAHVVSRSLSPRDGSHAIDLLDPAQVSALVAALRPTHLLHLAWVTAPGAYWASPDNHRWVGASLHLVREFSRHGGRRAVLAGTCAEYDWGHGVCYEERTPLAPATLYGQCKLQLHRQLAAIAGEAGLRVAWARLFFLYGPHEHPARLVPSVTRALLRGEEVVCSAGTQRRDFLHVADAARALVALLGSALEGAVNVASGQAVAVREVLGLIAAALNAPERARPGTRPAENEPPLVVGDVRRLRGELRWSPNFDLRRGILDTVAWWQARRGPAPSSSGKWACP